MFYVRRPIVVQKVEVLPWPKHEHQVAGGVLLGLFLSREGQNFIFRLAVVSKFRSHVSSPTSINGATYSFSPTLLSFGIISIILSLLPVLATALLLLLVLILLHEINYVIVGLGLIGD